MLKQINHRNNSISNTRILPDKPILTKLNQNSQATVVQSGSKVPSMMSLTATKFSQHHRAISELRSIQRQMHLDASEVSPPQGLPAGGKQSSPIATDRVLQV